MPYLSVVIPAYNEAQRLPDTLTVIKEYLAKQSYSAEVLIVDDGSTDDTVALVKKIMKNFSQLRLIENKHNQGKGGVVKQGMLAAKGEHRLFMDADNSTPLSELPNLLRHLPQSEVVIGSRYLEKGSIKVKQPLKRRIISRTCNIIIQLLLLPGIKDTQCGFKLFSAEAATQIFPKLTMTGWSFDIELLTVARKVGYSIKEVSVEWHDAKLSRFSASRGIIPFIKDMIVITRNSYQKKYQ